MKDTASPAPAPPSADGRPKRCRRRGRTALFGALALGVVAVLSFGAFQALGIGSVRHGACGGMEPAQLEKKIDRIAGWIVDDLDGTPEQEAKLAAIAKGAAKDLAPIHDELVAGRARAVELLTAETIDREALRAHRAKQMLLVEQATERLTTAVADAAEVLTPAQRAKAVDRLHDRFGRHGH